MKEIRTMLACALLSVAAVGCSKDDEDARVSPATGSRSVFYEVTTDDGGIELVPGTSLTWVSGYGHADEIKFEAKSESTEVMYKSKTDQEFDLFAPASLLGNITIPTGTYDKIKYKIRLEPSYPDAALRLDGQFTDNGLTVPVVFAINREVEMKVQGKDVLVLDGDDYLSVLTLQLDKLMDGITADMLLEADVDNDGTVYITEGSNRDLYHIMLENMEDFIKVECRKKKK